MVFDILIGKYKLSLLESVEITKNVDSLADTAVITVPGTAYNQALHIEEKVKRGDKIVIKIGYGDVSESPPEFGGYLLNIGTDNGNLTFSCENSIFLTRVAVADKVFNQTTVKQLLEYVADTLGFTVSCSYDFKYDTFTIVKATGYDVLKKIKDETGANIYIKDSVIHMHPAYTEITGSVKYNFSKNIETSELKYKTTEDRKFQVEVEGIGRDGKRITTTIGTPGGDKRSIKIYGIYDVEMLKKRGEEEMKYLVYDGYEGSITGWLLPRVEPGCSAHIRDVDYEYKNGWYFVVSVKTTFSPSGGARKVELGRKLSGANG